MDQNIAFIVKNLEEEFFSEVEESMQNLIEGAGLEAAVMRSSLQHSRCSWLMFMIPPKDIFK